MSGYYFDLRERRLLTPGHTGLEVDDADAVERQGAEAATRIGRDPSSRLCRMPQSRLMRTNIVAPA